MAETFFNFLINAGEKIDIILRMVDNGLDDFHSLGFDYFSSSSSEQFIKKLNTFTYILCVILFFLIPTFLHYFLKFHGGWI